MRLDKFLVATGCCSRSEAKKHARKGAVTVNGVAAKTSDMNIDENKDRVAFCGREIVYRRFTYVMLNKPEGVVSATEDGRDVTVLDLLPADVRTRGMFPCGRLDKYTLGLMLLTDDGELGHKLLAPKSHVEKSYRFESAHGVSEEERQMLESGVHIEGGYLTKPCRVVLDFEGASGGVITLREGKYHQIKQMLEAVSNKITYLERITFGPLVLDKALERGEWRMLSAEEEAALRASVEK